MAISLSRDDYQAAVEELNTLCRSEYGVGLVELLKDPNRDLTLERLRRLTGILLKQPLAEPMEIKAGEKTDTGSNYTWHWNTNRLQDPVFQSTPQYKLLSQLPAPGGFHELRERGVYKYLALWLKDKLKSNETKGFREYLAQPESAEFGTLLNIADFASQGVIGGVLAPMVGIPSVVVSLGLIGGKYSYQKLVEEAETSDR